MMDPDSLQFDVLVGGLVAWELATIGHPLLNILGYAVPAAIFFASF